MIFVWFLLALVIHELGHAFYLGIWGITPKKIRFASVKHGLLIGFGIEYNIDTRAMSEEQKFESAFSGPLANIMICFVPEMPRDFITVSILFACLTLIPFKNSDGWKVKNALSKMQ